MYNAGLRETLAVVSTIDPASQAAGTVLGDAVDMQKYRRVLFILSVGALGASATVDMKLVADTASGGSYATDLTGKAIAQLTKAGSDDNKQVAIEVTAEEVAAQGMRYVKPSVTVGTAACLVSLVGIAGFARYGQAADNDLASVDELV